MDLKKLRIADSNKSSRCKSKQLSGKSSYSNKRSLAIKK